jgi:serine/threonine-protein kinase HipA
MKLDSKLKSLGIHLHGRRIGVITRLAGDQHLFAFEEEYVDDPNRPMLSLSFKERHGGLLTSGRPVRRRIPPFFSNLLPEGPLREYLAEQAGVNHEHEFLLLAALGADLPGALTATPLADDRDRQETLDHPLHDPAQRDRDDGVLRFSLAGVQLKFSAVMDATGGLTIPAHGIGGSWIVKLPSTHFRSVPENEFAMLELARAAGIQVPDLRLTRVSEIQGLPPEAAQMAGRALAVRRFDRTADGPVHMEDFAQVFGIFPADKYKHRSYANIAAVLWAETGEDGTHEFVRRLVFSVLIGNGDMHLKNWSLLYPDRRTPVLSPAYDFVATFPYISNDKLALSFGGSRNLGEITTDQVRRFIDTAGLPASPIQNLVRETMDRTRQAWRALAEKDLLPSDLQRDIAAHIDLVLTRSRM